METKKRVIIQGERVHYVGYRPFLLAKAMKLGIKRFEAENLIEDEKQKVVVSFSGNEKQVKEFLEFIKKNYPPNARVSKIEELKVVDRIMSIDDYHKILAIEQQNTIVQVGLRMIGKQDVMIGKQDQILEKQDQILEKQDKMLEKQDQMLEKQDQTIQEIREVKEEIKDLRMDLKS